MEETVTIHDVHRICETTVQDLTPYIPNCLIEWWHNEVIHKEENANFWFCTESRFQIYTMFYTYLDQYIVNPKCCPKNRSSLFFQVEEHLTERVLDKINHGYEMLEKCWSWILIISLMMKTNPFTGELSIFSTDINWGVAHAHIPFSREGRDIICTLCIKDEIIKEELIHNEEMWYNTGYKNLYQMVKPLFIHLQMHAFRYLHCY